MDNTDWNGVWIQPANSHPLTLAPKPTLRWIQALPFSGQRFLGTNQMRMLMRKKRRGRKRPQESGPGAFGMELVTSRHATWRKTKESQTTPPCRRISYTAV